MYAAAAVLQLLLAAYRICASLAIMPLFLSCIIAGTWLTASLDVVTAVSCCRCTPFSARKLHPRPDRSGVDRSANRSDPTRPQVIGVHVGLLSLPLLPCHQRDGSALPHLGLLAPTPSKLQVIGVGVLSLPFSVSWLGWVAGIAMMLLFAWITQVGC